MNETILTFVAIVGAFGLMGVIMYRLGPGISDAMSAWAKKQDITDERIKIWAEGFREGQEAERARNESDTRAT